MNLYDLLDGDDLDRMIAAGYVRDVPHPTEPLRILNYTQRCQYDRAWNDVTRACRGLIYRDETGEIVARPWPKFHNYGEHQREDRCPSCGDPARAPGDDCGRDDCADALVARGHLGVLDLDAAVEVTDKLDGSLGILYPFGAGAYAIATRGSFTSEQAFRGTARLLEAARDGFRPIPGFTYLFEIVYPSNRIVVDYGDRDELVLLGVVDIETGIVGGPRSNVNWTGPTAEILPASTLREALELEPRPNAEGIVVRYMNESGGLVKIKQDDYVALHRILTGTNARNVWEVAAVHACAGLIDDPKHWGSFLGIDPARAEEVLALGEAWLDGVPDEFHSWVRETIETAGETVDELLRRADDLIRESRALIGIGAGYNRRRRYEHVHAAEHPAEREILRIADGRVEERDRLLLRCWREATPAPTAPFARDEDVA